MLCMRPHLLALVLGVGSPVDDALRVVHVAVTSEAAGKRRVERVRHVHSVQSA